MSSNPSATVKLEVLTTWICGSELDASLFAPLTFWLPLPLDSELEVRPEPLPVPVASVPPLPPLVNCSPTVMFTAATVPSNVATSCAPASAVCADLSWSCADVRLE